MSEIHFRSNFWPFQIDTQLHFFFFFLTKWLPPPILDVHNSLLIAFLAISDRYAAAVGHIGCPKITFDHISYHFRSICNFFFNFLTKWLPAAILDVRNSLSIAFLAISNRYATLIVFESFDKMAAVGHFGFPKLTFYGISGHFGCPKITFDHISGHFR